MACALLFQLPKQFIAVSIWSLLNFCISSGLMTVILSSCAQLQYRLTFLDPFARIGLFRAYIRDHTALHKNRHKIRDKGSLGTGDELKPKRGLEPQKRAIVDLTL